MFFGKGDSSQLTERERETFDHIRRLDETGHIIGLDHKTSESAIRGIDAWNNFEGFFQTVTSVRNIAILIAFILATYYGAEAFLLDWIREALNGS